MDRLELEFRMDASITRSELDELDCFFQHKRWLKQKEKALLRDWQREKQELKEKTVAMIEQQVEEQSQRLKKEFEQMKMSRIKAEKHDNLDELRKEYQYKMDIIEEIKREKELREKQTVMIKEMKAKKRADQLKGQASQFRQEKDIERQK